MDKKSEIARAPSTLKGKSVRLVKGTHRGSDFLVDDWWENVSGGKSWRQANTPLSLNYARRLMRDQLPEDNQVLCGVVNGSAVLIHETEIGAINEAHKVD